MTLTPNQSDTLAYIQDLKPLVGSDLCHPRTTSSLVKKRLIRKVCVKGFHFWEITPEGSKALAGKAE